MKNNWPTKKLGEVADFLDNLRKPVTASDRVSGPYPYYGANGQQDSVNDYIFDDELVLLAEDGGYFGSKTRPVAYRVSGKCWVNNHAHVLKNKDGVIDIDFLGYSLMYYDVTPYISGTTRAKLNKSEAIKISLKVPPLSTQKQIVERMDKIVEAQKLNDDLIQKSAELFQSLLHKELNPAGKDWEIKKLEDHAFITSGGTPRRNRPEFFDGTIPWVKSGELKDGFVFDTEEKITQEGLDKSSAKVFPIDTVLIAMYGATVGKVGMLKVEATTNQAIAGIQPKKGELDPYFVFYFLLLTAPILVKRSIGGAQPNINQGMVKKLIIPFPPLETQKQIVAKLSAVQDYKTQLLIQKSKLKELFDSVLGKSMKGEMDD